MKTIVFNDKTTGEPIQIAYSDYGTGRPIVLIHGWPLSSETWEYQVTDLVNNGNRVIQYDRRGFGQSSKPWSGYDYDTLTNDLHQLLEQLDLHDVVLAGFSMGGGEVAKYMSQYNKGRVTGIVLINSVVPYFFKTADSSEGVSQEAFDKIVDSIKEDRMNYLEGFLKKFFGFGFLHQPVSNALLQYHLQLAAKAAPHATLACIRSFSTTDFSKDVATITVPTLIIHGDSDEIVKVNATSTRTAAMLPHAEMVMYPGAPHGLFYTHRHHFNHDLKNFMKRQKLEPMTEEAIPIPEPVFLLP